MLSTASSMFTSCIERRRLVLSYSITFVTRKHAVVCVGRGPFVSSKNAARTYTRYAAVGTTQKELPAFCPHRVSEAAFIIRHERTLRTSVDTTHMTHIKRRRELNRVIHWLTVLVRFARLFA